jgi:hypothetical protein
VILLTDDAKEDWWQIQGDRTIGPRPELIAEFLVECQQAFYMYSSGRFMELSKLYLKESVEEDAIKEVQERLTEQLRTSSDMKPIRPPNLQDRSDDKTTVLPEPAKPANLKPVITPSVNTGWQNADKATKAL